LINLDRRSMRRPIPGPDAAAEPYLPRAEALDLLGVKPQTLYAYVSRGWIRSVRRPGGGRQSLYSRDDLEKVRSRALARSGHAPTAAAAMRWGEPIIPTAITAITPQGPRYRGRLAIDLVQSGATFEWVAELLWSGLPNDDPVLWTVAPVPAEVRRLAQPATADADRLIERFVPVIALLGIAPGAVAERAREPMPLAAARQTLQVLAGCLGLLAARPAFRPLHPGESMASGLLRAMGAEADAENVRAMQAILILLADHELTPSTFAARVTASTGALLHGCVAAALAANSGSEVGRLYDRVRAFLDGAGTAATMMARARELQTRNAAPPGFNHPLYPRGDPRALCLLEMTRARRKRPPKLRQLHAFLEEAEARMGLHPRVETGVVALCLAMGLPSQAPGALFTLARTAGWVAHVIEQRTAGFMLRPRAKYTGP
jgi:citrate synthase